MRDVKALSQAGGALLQASADSLQKGLDAYAAGDYSAAAALVLPLAEAGLAEAQFWMGAFHANGEWVAADPKAAYAWCLLAARQGHVLAQANLAGMLVQGFGVAQTMPRPRAG